MYSEKVSPHDSDAENSVIGPNVNIDKNTYIGPNSHITNSVIGKNCFFKSDNLFKNEYR